MKFYAALSLLLLNSEFAWARGGTCGEDESCQFTGLIVLGILVVLFITSVVDSVREKGFIRGLVEHGGVRALFFYISMMGSFMLATVLVFQLWGDTAAIWFCLACAATLFYVNSILDKRRDTQDPSGGT